MYSVGRALSKRATTSSGQFLRRWPDRPQVLIFGAPNVPVTKLSQRLAIDLGVPVINMQDVYKNIQEHAGHHEDFSHPFYLKVKEILDNGDPEEIAYEKIGVKLLRINEYAQEGFILNDFPNSVADAESLEEMHGGMNAFLHLNMPEVFLAQLESTKYECRD